MSKLVEVADFWTNGSESMKEDGDDDNEKVEEEALCCVNETGRSCCTDLFSNQQRLAFLLLALKYRILKLSWRTRNATNVLTALAGPSAW